MEKFPSEITNKYFLTAAEVDAQGRMPMWLIVSRVIEAATDHANLLHLGYADMIERGLAWVLTRLSVEMSSYLGVNEDYTVTTWIEGYNRLYSDRCFEIRNARGEAVGHIRSMWVAIDVAKRTAADLTALDRSHFQISERRCPVSHHGKQRPLGPEAVEQSYTFRYCDIDYNRHVNTVQYVRHILNQWPLDHYDRCSIGRFEITFQHECHFGDTVTIRHTDPEPSRSLCEIIDPTGRQAVTAALTWQSQSPPAP